MLRPIFHRLLLATLVVGLTICPAVAAIAAPGPGVAAKAAKSSARHASKRVSKVGGMYAAVRDDGLPVAIQVSRDGREVVRMAAAVPLRCQPSGNILVLPAAFAHVPISGSGAFHASAEAHEGEVTLVGSVTGRFNPAMTAVATTWTMKVTLPNAGGSDTCESGASSFTASR
jgi:hypothetical protein